MDGRNHGERLARRDPATHAALMLTLAGLLCAFPGPGQAQPGLPPAGDDPAKPLILGSREAVGKESIGDKAVKGVLGAVLGGRGGGAGPRTRRDPTRKLDYVEQSSGPSGPLVAARAAWREQGLLVSSRIEDDDQKGTFHTVFLQDCEGRRRYPAAVEIYAIWSEASISVAWSRTSTVDGRVVDSASGGWSTGAADEGRVPGEAGGPEAGPMPGLWQQAGYARAHGGIRQVGAYFAVDPSEFTDCAPGVYVHVSRPEQDPVVTEAVAFTLDGAGTGAEIAVLAGYTAVSAPAGSVAGPPPCEEALLRVEERRTALLAQLDDPLRLLAAAMQAAADLGAAVRVEGEAQAALATEAALLESLQSYLAAWDQWFAERMEQRERSREARHGAREPSWARGSRARSERRHQEQTADLRTQVEGQQQAVASAQQAAAAAAQARQSAQERFDRAVEDFERALAALRHAKDAFAELVVEHYRCSPCKAIASHWQSAARLRELLDRLAAMLGQRQAAVAAALALAEAGAAEAAAEADAAAARQSALEQRRSAIEQEMRDAVDTADGCLSLEPVEGAGWMNLASMEGTRGTVVAEGAVMAWRSQFKGSEVKVWARDGCLQAKIENVDWGRINELNGELADLQGQLESAAAEAARSKGAAAHAQAAVDGLQAEADALGRLQRALRDSGLGANTDQVLERLDELSEDCEQAMKDAIRGASDARRRQGEAGGRIAGATAKGDSLRRRAGKAADELDDMDPSVGTGEDGDAHAGLKGKADRLAGGGGGISPTPGPIERPPPPETLDDAEEQRKQAEQAADEAEAEADALEDEVEGLEDEVEDLEDEVDELAERLREWRDYHAALARYEDCLRRKQAAIEELAELNAANASALQELARRLGEAAGAVSDVAGAAGDVSRVDEDVAEAAEQAEKLAGALERLGNALEVIDAVMRADELTPSEKLEAMSKAFEELREWLPELPGVSEMLEFYNEAMKAIAGKLAEIEDVQIKQWADLVEAGIADPDDAPIGIREEVRKAAKIRELMKIITRHCGKAPTAPAGG